MSMRYLQVSMRQDGEIAILELKGELNALSFADLGEAFTQAQTSKARALVIDFTQVDYMNSAGISAIIRTISQGIDANMFISACGLSEHFREVFTVMRLTDYLHIRDTLEQCLIAARQTLTLPAQKE
jgi:anti-sigma B factor antagonist